MSAFCRLTSGVDCVEAVHKSDSDGGGVSTDGGAAFKSLSL